jgi:hypothetical protein
LSGLINFSQSGLDALTHGPLNGNPTAINIALGAVSAVIGTCLTAFTAVRGREFAQEKAKIEECEEQQQLLEERHGGYGTRD